MTVAISSSPVDVPGIPPSPDGLNILVVDDNPVVAELLARVLEEAGHFLRVVYDGTAAIAAALIDRPDVLILDISLPGADGWEVCRRLRAAPGGDTCFVVAVTGDDTDEARRRSKLVGVDLHLGKPVDVTKLVGMLDGYRLR